MQLDGFIDYLKNEKGKSHNTLEAYKRDIAGFFKFLDGERTYNAESYG